MIDEDEEEDELMDVDCILKGIGGKKMEENYLKPGDGIMKLKKLLDLSGINVCQDSIGYSEDCYEFCVDTEDMKLKYYLEGNVLEQLRQWLTNRDVEITFIRGSSEDRIDVAVSKKSRFFEKNSYSDFGIDEYFVKKCTPFGKAEHEESCIVTCDELSDGGHISEEEKELNEGSECLVDDMDDIQSYISENSLSSYEEGCCRKYGRKLFSRKDCIRRLVQFCRYARFCVYEEDGGFTSEGVNVLIDTKKMKVADKKYRDIKFDMLQYITSFFEEFGISVLCARYCPDGFIYVEAGYDCDFFDSEKYDVHELYYDEELEDAYTDGDGVIHSMNCEICEKSIIVRTDTKETLEICKKWGKVLYHVFLVWILIMIYSLI